MAQVSLLVLGPSFIPLANSNICGYTYTIRTFTYHDHAVYPTWFFSDDPYAQLNAWRIHLDDAVSTMTRLDGTCRLRMRTRLDPACTPTVDRHIREADG
jgi:hypothetical protein